MGGLRWNASMRGLGAAIATTALVAACATTATPTATPTASASASASATAASRVSTATSSPSATFSDGIESGTPPRTTGSPHYYGTLEPFAAHAIYFVVTDRFVNGDTSNDQRDQGGAHRSFDIPLHCPDGTVDNIGYLGGDFRGLLDHADYIADMGFGAVWITPVVENPDQAFTGGDEISCTSFLTDRGKAAYHGYWGTNFYRLDEHLPSANLDFRAFTDGMRAKGLKTVLDIVGNHGSPSFSMPVAQPQFGQVFDADGALVADHQNLRPEQLDPANNPLHRFYNTRPDLAQLGDFDADNPTLVDYLVGSYLHWIDEGADAFRIDTIRHQPLAFWKTVSDRIRAHRPGFYLFGEAFDHEAKNIAPFTWPEHGAISVLDFPLKAALVKTFGRESLGYETLADTLYLDAGPYQNPYDLATFYDNHDMARLDAADEGFIDAHNFLFTARGIPVIYYGSEMGFMRGRVEHHGNRNYFGVENIAAASSHRIHAALRDIATVRANTPALQRGLQLDLEMAGDRAAFYRVLQHDGVAQAALVLLNKGDAAATFDLGDAIQPGTWRNATDKRSAASQIAAGQAHTFKVAPHGVSVWVMDAPVTNPRLRAKLDALMQRTVVK